VRTLVLWMSIACRSSTPGGPVDPAPEGDLPAGEASDGDVGALRPPVQTRPPNAAHQQPAFPEQTRAPQPAVPTAFDVTTVAAGIAHPWGMERLPDGRLLVTERPGRLRIVGADGAIGEPIEGLPEVDARGQGGLLDVALAPDFPSSRRIFWSYAEPRGGRTNGTSVATGVLTTDERALQDVRVVFRQEPAWASTAHFGSRLLFAPDGTLFVTLGERSQREARQHAQNITDHLGTIVRIRPDGGAPPDNPFVGRPDARPEIWSYGHRNVQGATIGPGGALWTVEHGPQGGDELNRVERGGNHGWPVITYGEAYGGGPLGEGTARDGVVQPVYYWDPVIGPSGTAWYTHDRFPGWDGSLLVSGLVAGSLVRLQMRDDGRVATEEWLRVGRRVRDVLIEPEGTVLILTDEPDGRVMRLTPAGG